jgi:ATP-dependent Clp protease protease subunit
MRRRCLVEAVEADQDSDDAPTPSRCEADDTDEDAPKAISFLMPKTSRPPPTDTLSLDAAETPPPSGAPPDPAAIRAEAIGHARAVVDLCRLAGQPQMAGRFLEEDVSLDAVRAALCSP